MTYQTTDHKSALHVPHFPLKHALAAVAVVGLLTAGMWFPDRWKSYVPPMPAYNLGAICAAGTNCVDVERNAYAELQRVWFKTHNDIAQEQKIALYERCIGNGEYDQSYAALLECIED